MPNDKKRFDAINKIFTKSNSVYNEDKIPEQGDNIKAQLESYQYKAVLSDMDSPLYKIMDVVDSSKPDNYESAVYLYIYSIEYHNNPILYSLLFNYETHLSFIKTTIDKVDNILELIFPETTPLYKGYVNHMDKNIMCYEINNLSQLCDINSNYKIGVMYELVNICHIENISIHREVTTFFLENPSLIHLYINEIQVETPIVVALYSDDKLKNNSLVDYAETIYYTLDTSNHGKIVNKFILFLKDYKYINKKKLLSKKYNYILNDGNKISFHIKNGLDILFFYSY